MDYKKKYIKYKKKYLKLTQKGGSRANSLDLPSDQTLDQPVQRAETSPNLEYNEQEEPKCISLDRALNKKCNDDKDPITLEEIDYSNPQNYFKYTDTNHCITKDNYDLMKEQNNFQIPQNPVSRNIIPCRNEIIEVPELENIFNDIYGDNFNDEEIEFIDNIYNEIGVIYNDFNFIYNDFNFIRNEP